MNRQNDAIKGPFTLADRLLSADNIGVDCQTVRLIFFNVKD